MEAKKPRYSCTIEELFQRVRDKSENGIAPSVVDVGPERAQLYKRLNRMSWKGMCELMGLEPRQKHRRDYGRMETNKGNKRGELHKIITGVDKIHKLL